MRTIQGGPSFEAITFVVLGGPIIYELSPNPTERGTPLTIIGDGFDITHSIGSVTVEFAGSALPAVPTLVRDTSIEVVVPDDAITGVVRVAHPAGAAESPGPLTIDDGSPLVYNFDHTLVEAGDTLLILGRNLTGATAVTFAGGPQVPASPPPKGRSR